jgi:hypothetical protein
VTITKVMDEQNFVEVLEARISRDHKFLNPASSAMEFGLDFVQTPNRINRRRKMVDRIRPIEEPTVIEPLRVRGRQFQKGNPGRPLGSKNKLTRLLEQLVEGQGQNLTQKMLELALDGNPRCLEYFMERLMPPRRGRVLEQPLPKISGVNDIGPAIATITNQLNNGELTTEEASDMFGLLERRARAILASGLAERVEKIEAQLKQMKSFER